MINDIQVYRPGIGLIYPYGVDRRVVQHGDVLRVHVAFEYRQPQGFTCDVIVYLGTRTSKVLTSTNRLTLPPASEFEPASSVNDLEISDKAAPGIYNLGVEIPQGDEFVEIPAVIEVEAKPGLMDSIGQLIPLVMMMMMMGMMMNVMEE